MEEPVTKERKRELYKGSEKGGVEEIGGDGKFNARNVLKSDGISLAILFLLYVLQGTDLKAFFIEALFPIRTLGVQNKKPIYKKWRKSIQHFRLNVPFRDGFRSC